jgi:hypothetical protein|tara:strand:+ start:202 stop:990 length:789 start_codon:yes stop_codon:yes gene_type:complete
MKTIFNLKLKLTKLLSILFLLPSIGEFGQRVNAQSIDILLNSDWGLEESNVNGISISLENLGGRNFYSPHNEFFFIHDYGASCFESFKVSYTDVTETSFELSNIFDYVSCNYTDPEEIEAVELYQSFYFELPFDTNSTPKNPFTYEWIDSGLPVEDLIITNPDGDWLLYRRAYLSTPTFEKSNFIVYPNPSKNILNIKNSNIAISDAYIGIHDILGNLLKFEHNIATKSNFTLNVSHLNSGLYFLTIENKEGFKQTLKFIKQ